VDKTGVKFDKMESKFYFSFSLGFFWKIFEKIWQIFAWQKSLRKKL